VATLVVTELRARPPKPVAASAAVVGREALDAVNAGLRRVTGECLRSGRSLPDLFAVVYSEERRPSPVAAARFVRCEPPRSARFAGRQRGHLGGGQLPVVDVYIGDVAQPVVDRLAVGLGPSDHRRAAGLGVAGGCLLPARRPST
jgi:hypothetical protein